MQIKLVKGREILDSRGWPTLEVEITLTSGYRGRCSVPSGASTGAAEAFELRDKDTTRYQGRGVLKAINKLHNIVAPTLFNTNIESQLHLDNILIDLDGTINKDNLGANTILATSIAFAQAAAQSKNQPLYQYLSNYITYPKPYYLPTPMLNIINGGMHADNALILQEFMIVPTGNFSFSEKLQQAAEVIYKLKDLLKKNKLSINCGDEGGFAPNLSSTEEALDYITTAIQGNNNVKIAIDAAATTFFYQNLYHYYSKTYTAQQLTDYYKNLLHNYSIISLEDALDENDIVGWQHLTSELGNKIQLVGDDLFVTNPKLLQIGINNNIANAILIKPNQIGTLTETIEAIKLAQANNYNVIISHRSGETEDTAIAHLAVASRADYIKTGSLARSERTAKYNELLRIEEDIKEKFSNYA